MNPTPILLAACVMLSGCASTAQTVKLMNAYTDNANKLDPDCGKDLKLKTNYMVVPWGIIPLLDLDYHKVCHPEVLDGKPPVTVGTTIGGPN